MHFEARTVRKTINKAFLKEPVERGSFDQFKEALGKLLNGIEQANEAGEREEHFKNLLPFGVMMEVKRPSNKSEIDRLVNELYGLSEEEIGVVEGGN